MRILFITHKNTIYGITQYSRRSSGLYNSTNFIVKGLRSLGVHAEIVEVQDNNCIDREVHKFKPDIVVIEALWVVPTKFKILKKLHPKVKWFIHMHSGIPFLAQEGMACGWLIDSAREGVDIIANSPDSFTAFSSIIPSDQLKFLPNVYLHKQHSPRKHRNSHIMHIGCFGAIRPLKNHLSQAFAALKFSRDLGKVLHFHVNSTRTESGGAPIVKNLRELFDRLPDAKLIEHGWHEPEDFVNLLHLKIDIGMQVSLSETFNVVSADCITAGIPVVGSREIPWMSTLNMAKDDDIEDMVKILHRVWNHPTLTTWNQFLLRRFAHHSLDLWYNWLKHHVHGC